MEWVASTLHTTTGHGVSKISTAVAHTSAATDAPADLNGLIRFAKRQNLVSAHVPSHFKRSLQHVTSLFLAALCRKLKLLSNCHLPLLSVT